MQKYKVDFQPIGRRGTCSLDKSLLEAARQMSIDILSTCGGDGICGDCKVQVVEGRVSDVAFVEEDHLSQRELEQGYRLACSTFPLSDCRVRVPAESMSTLMRTQVEGQELQVAVQSAVQSATVKLDPPSLEHPQADANNLLENLHEQHEIQVDRIDISVLHDLSDWLREWDWRCEAHIRAGELITVAPPATPAIGLAVDLGSTKIAGYLVDLVGGKTLAAQGMMNPQISYGEDIVSRLSRAMKAESGREQMQGLVIDALNELAMELCTQVGVSQNYVLDAVIVGNTAMHHLLLGLPIRQLAFAPFVPGTSGSVDVRARDLGLQLAPGAYLYIPPVIAGFVGADHVAMLIATESEWSDQNVIALDIGTNTEISLTTREGHITSVSCASGPAFEGYQIKDGTRAKAGAIEKVLISGENVYYETIDNAPAAGICGSGILDAVAQMSLVGIINSGGRMQAGGHQRIREDDGKLEFLLARVEGGEGEREIVVTQNDVREIQLAKASIQAGIEILLAEDDLTLSDLDRVVIAGAFGSYIDVESAVAIGMFPALPLEKFHQVGNAAGMGAKQMLLSTNIRARAADLHARIDYVELATYPTFSRIFAQNCSLKPYVG